MKSFLLAVSFSLSLITIPSHAALMKFSFTGEITAVENSAAEVWDAATLTGQSIQGYFLMDTEIAKGGREETSYYWWHNIDSGPGALTSAIGFLDNDYLLTSDHDYLPMYDGWSTDEFLDYYSGDVNENGEPVADGIALRDNENAEKLVSGGTLYNQKELSIGFFDSINDFLTDFRYVAGEVEPQPDWQQEFIWQDDGMQNNGKSSGGTFSISESFYGDLPGQIDRNVDSKLTFKLNRVVAAPLRQINTPATFLLILAGLVVWISSSKLKRRFEL